MVAVGVENSKDCCMGHVDSKDQPSDLDVDNPMGMSMIESMEAGSQKVTTHFQNVNPLYLTGMLTVVGNVTTFPSPSINEAHTTV